jgi:hypothetical protein
MDEKRLQEIKARVDAATPGPWAIYPRRKSAVKAVFLTRLGSDGSSMWTWPGFVRAQFTRDAEFIAHARQDMPDLLAENERLRAALEGIEWIKIENHPGLTYWVCPWCNATKTNGHRDDCSRQWALGGR